ncbi:MAG: choice-of-anchor V domain-containing protein [Bacteroidota bacterium]
MTKNLRSLVTILTMALLIAGTAFFSESSLTANNAGAPSMRTGSPGDTKSCTNCHSGTSQNVTGILTTNIPPTGYIPGSTYIIEAICNDPAKNRFGFEISPQNLTGAKLGVITITDAARTKLVGSGKYVTHTAAGTSGTGTITWSFNWTAPPAGSGDVIFYGAFNFSNHNNASGGDIIKLDHITLFEDLTTWTETISSSEEIKLYPNPVADVAHLIIGESTQLNRVSIYNSIGVIVRVVDNESLDNHFEINVATLAAGTYYVSFATAKGNYSGKLIKL